MNNYSLNFSDDFRPLAARMRPRSLQEYIGQTHLLSTGKPLRLALEKGQLHSMVFWGAPGTGKTTLASVIANMAQAKMLSLSAVTSGVKDIRLAIEKARENQSVGIRTLVFVDEVHRFNATQQDAFLPHIEEGLITFIGATTENPSFALNNALLSRARVYKLRPLSTQEIVQLIEQALQDKERGLGHEAFCFSDSIKWQLADFVSGDARMALNCVELLSDLAPIKENQKQISLELLAEVVNEKVARFDNKGDLWYDLISAFHKSVRGSNPDAALYWYARIVQAGGDPLYVARRLLAIASEDIGNADPRAMEIALNAWDCFLRLGAAEGERAIAQAVVYLALAPKSNAVYIAWNKALADAAEYSHSEVPNHLRNAPTALMKDLGYGNEYRYAHDEPHAYAAGERYLPSEIKEKRYYQPVQRGLEIKLAEKLAFLTELDRTSKLKR